MKIFLVISFVVVNCDFDRFDGLLEKTDFSCDLECIQRANSEWNENGMKGNLMMMVDKLSNKPFEKIAHVQTKNQTEGPQKSERRANRLKNFRRRTFIRHHTPGRLPSGIFVN